MKNPKENNNTNLPKKIEQWIVDLIKENQFLILRDRRTHKALGVGYGMDGITQVTNKHGKLLYYKNARISGEWKDGIPNGQWLPKVVGDTTPSEKVYVEKFIPRNHKLIDNQVAEYLWVDKAMRMLYTPNRNY